MSNAVFVKSYPEPKLNIKEILRYMGGAEGEEQLAQLTERCINECEGSFTYKVCYGHFPVETDGDYVNLPFMTIKSKALAKNLSGCREAIIFGATVGIEIDRLIARYGRISPAKAVVFQAIGAERIESLCDMFCADMEKELKVKLKPRFSPGYGDLPLEVQRSLFAVLDCPRKIGLSLLESCLMSPSKSVTAIMGIKSDTSLERT